MFGKHSPAGQDMQLSFANVDRRIAMSFGALILALLVIVLLSGGIYYRGIMKSEQDNLSTLVTRILANSVNRISFSGKYHARLLLEEIKAAQPGIRYLMVADKEGRVFAHSDPALNDTLLDEGSMHAAQVVLKGKEREIRELVIDGEPVRDVTLAYRGGYDNEIAGVVRVGLSDHERATALKPGYFFLSALVLALLVIGVLASFWIGRHFGRPVKRLARDLAATIHAIPDLLFELDEHGRYLSVMAGQQEDLLADTKAHLLGHTVAEVLPAPETAVVMAALREAAARGASHGSQIHLQVAQGDAWFELSVAAKEIVPGESRRFVVLSRDITGRKRSEEALQSMNRDFITFLENTSDFIYFKDESSRFRFCSQTLANITGHASWRDMIGKHDLEVFPEETARIYYEEESPIFQDGKPLLNKTDPYIDAQGRRGWVNTNKWPVFDESGKHVVGIFGISRDISELKQAEEDLKHLNETLAEEVREQVAHNMEQERLLIQQSRLAAMGEMVHNIAHQWRQPINALTLLLANIKDSYEFNELTREYLDSEVKTGQRLIQGMSTTIDDFRNFFMPNKEREFFLADDSVDDAIKLVSDSFATHNIKIVREKDGEPCFVTGYPNEFAQVVLNALTNAKEAIVGKNVAGEIHVKISKGENDVIVTIRDNGGGILEEILPKVFDPYFTTKESGSGIGLYMSKMIMKNMGGNITIRNVEDGAEALLTLSLASNAAV